MTRRAKEVGHGLIVSDGHVRGLVLFANGTSIGKNIWFTHCARTQVVGKGGLVCLQNYSRKARMGIPLSEMCDARFTQQYSGVSILFFPSPVRVSRATCSSSSEDAVTQCIRWLEDRPRDFVTDMKDLHVMLLRLSGEVLYPWLQKLGLAAVERVANPTAQQQLQHVLEVPGVRDSAGAAAAADDHDDCAVGASGRVNSIQAQSRVPFLVDDGGGTSGDAPPPASAAAAAAGTKYLPLALRHAFQDLKQALQLEEAGYGLVTSGGDVRGLALLVNFTPIKGKQWFVHVAQGLTSGKSGVVRLLDFSANACKITGDDNERKIGHLRFMCNQRTPGTVHTQTHKFPQVVFLLFPIPARAAHATSFSPSRDRQEAVTQCIQWFEEQSRDFESDMKDLLHLRVDFRTELFYMWFLKLGLAAVDSAVKPTARHPQHVLEVPCVCDRAGTAAAAAAAAPGDDHDHDHDHDDCTVGAGGRVNSIQVQEVCSRCGGFKDVFKLSRQRKGTGGIRSSCKVCDARSNKKRLNSERSFLTALVDNARACTRDRNDKNRGHVEIDFGC